MSRVEATSLDEFLLIATVAEYRSEAVAKIFFTFLEI